jgi:hypothetical protein
MFEVTDVWVWDDAAKDFRVFTMTGGALIRTMLAGECGVSGRLPFTPIRPEPLPEYFWGRSVVQALMPLQHWFDERVKQVDHIVQKILDPPRVGYGMGNFLEEKLSALGKSGGVLAIPTPTGKVEEFKPNVPDEVFKVLDSMSEYFIELSGMRPSMFGRQEPGVRTEGMSANLMRVSAAEIRRKALTVERQVEDAAQLMWGLIRRGSTDELLGPDGQPFKPADFPESARVQVDGHSASPLFAEDHGQMAEALRRAGAVDPESLLDLVNPPLKGLLKHRLKRVLFAKMVGEAVVKAEQEAKRSGKEAVGKK